MLGLGHPSCLFFRCFHLLTQGKFGAVAEGVRASVSRVLLYQSLKMIKTRTPHGKFSIYPAHPFLICTVQYCPRFHFPKFDGRSKACSSTRHGAWALDNTRRRPPLGPASRSYHPCNSRNQPAPLIDHRPLPRGGIAASLARPSGTVLYDTPTRDFVPVRKKTPPFLTRIPAFF